MDIRVPAPPEMHDEPAHAPKATRDGWTASDEERKRAQGQPNLAFVERWVGELIVSGLERRCRGSSDLGLR